MRRDRGAFGLICGLATLMLAACVQPLPSRFEPPARALSVCELSRNFAGYAGQTIMVRGIYYAGLRQACPQRCPSGEPWPSRLALVDSQFARETGVTVPFATGRDSWDALDRSVLRVAAAGEKAEVWATVEGYLVVRANSSLGPCDLVANGMIVGNLAWYGAQLVVKDVRNVEIRPNAATGYDYSVYLRKPAAQ